MAESSDVVQETEEAKKKVVLEEKSKEELIKIVKKQLGFLQKAKSRTEELNKKCATLEEEKNLAVEKQETVIIDLQQQLETLELKICDITETSDKVSKEKSTEIAWLNDKIKSLEAEKNGYFASLNEKEEQIQCLSMQLTTVKETCHCLQDELSNLQKRNSDLKEEISVLLEARNTALEALKAKNIELDSRTEECSVLIDKSNKLEKKYSICLEENCLLASKIQNFETEIKNLRQGNADLLSRAENTEVSDFSILIRDNQKLQEEVNLLRKECGTLKESPYPIKNETTPNNEMQIKEISEMKKENFELQQHLCSVESINSQLKQMQSSSEEEIQNLRKKVQLLEADKQNQTVELETVLKEKLLLKEEVRRLLSSLQGLTEFKTGYEFALLHGAAAESFSETSAVENNQNIDSKRLLESEPAENSLSKKITESSESTVKFDATEPGTGFEFGVLSGGAIDEIYDNSEIDSPSKVVPLDSEGYSVGDKFEMDEKLEINESQTKETEQVFLYELLKLDKEHLVKEIKKLKTRVEEYASMLQETLSDNESMKLALEKCQKDHSSASLNNELEVAEKLPHTGKEFETTIVNLENHISSLKKRIEILESEKSEYSEKNSSLVNDVDSLNAKIKSLEKMLQDLEIQNKNITLHSDLLEKQNFEISKKFNKKCEELDNINSQLELLAINVKEVLYHKHSTSSPPPKKAEKQLSDNISLITKLLADLIISCNDNSLKVKTLDDTLNDILIKKQAVDEELLQMKELNQFLEDEARELRNEVEQMKIDHNSLFEQPDDNYCRDQCLRSPNELYSIEEIDDDPPVDNISLGVSELNAQKHCTDTEGKEDDKISSEYSGITSAKSDISIQVYIPGDEDDTNPLPSKKNQDNNFDMDHSLNLKSICEYKSIVEQLETENSSLKDSLNSKSALIERIHSELDSQLEKVEELTEELEMKDKSIMHSQNLSRTLQEKLNELKLASVTTTSFIEHLKNILNELQNDKTKLKSDISSLNSFSVEALSTIRNYLSATVYEYEEKMKIVTNRCIHMNEVSQCMMLQLGKISKDFGLWLNILTNMSNTRENSTSFLPSNDDINLLKQTYENLDNDDVFEGMCSNDCCLVINDLKNLKIVKQEFLSILCDSFFNYYQSIVNELNEYKNSIVPNLKSTVTILEDKLSSSSKDVKEEMLLEKKLEESNEDSSVAHFKTQLAETEIKMNKCKQIALKLKKELQESKKQTNEVKLEKEKYFAQLTETQKELDKISSEHFHYVQNYQSLQNEYDKTQDVLEIEKENVKKLEADLSSTLIELNALKEKIADMNSQLSKANLNLEIIESSKQEKEKLNAELESKLIVIESKKQDKIHKIEELEADLKTKMEQINNLIDENNNLKAQLQSSQKDENKKNLLHLEMADYERSILELNNKIQKKEDEISDLKQKLNCEIEKSQGLWEEIESTEKLKETEQKRADSLKEMLDQIKSELALTKERETELLTKVSHLQMQLEIVVQQEENCKLQLSETSAEIQHLKEMLKTSSENHQRIVHTLETKVSLQKQEILCAHKEVESIKQEFENYKIRVHSVLKQQKSTAPILTPIEENEKEKLESMLEKLKMQVKQLSEKLSAVSMEYEALQEEHDTLLQRYNKSIEERENKDAEWHTKLEQLNAEKNKLRAAQEELSSRHLLQNEMLVSTYKKQIKIMSDEYKRTVDELQKQLESADLEIARLQMDQQKTHGLPLTPTVQDNPISFDILSQERQEGEGSESIDGSDTPIRHLSLATIPTSGFLPFEKLLQSPHEEFSTSASFISNQDNDKLFADLKEANKKIEHLSEVLNESESTNLRLSEQVRVLKEEVRRLERNKEREQHAENLEYLKNVFIKFATLSPGSEKAMLIPVLTTMLKLSPTEQQQLKSISGDIDSSEAPASGWGSYLHRWSGLA